MVMEKAYSRRIRQISQEVNEKGCIRKEGSKEGSSVNKQTIYAEPKSTNKSWCITTPEPVWGQLTKEPISREGCKNWDTVKNNNKKKCQQTMYVCIRDDLR